jgi:hypothetical protein
VAIISQDPQKWRNHQQKWQSFFDLWDLGWYQLVKHSKGGTNNQCRGYKMMCAQCQHSYLFQEWSCKVDGQIFFTLFHTVLTSIAQTCIIPIKLLLLGAATSPLVIGLSQTCEIPFSHHISILSVHYHTLKRAAGWRPDARAVGCVLFFFSTQSWPWITHHKTLTSGKLQKMLLGISSLGVPYYFFIPQLPTNVFVL